MVLMVLGRYGIVNQWPLAEADPGCLPAHHWLLPFICSLPGCLSFPEGNTQHALTLWLSKGLPQKKESTWEMEEADHVCVCLFDVSDCFSLYGRYIQISPHAKDKLRLCLLVF